MTCQSTRSSTAGTATARSPTATAATTVDTDLPDQINGGRHMNETKCRAIVRERSGEICEICAERRADTMHHRRKRSQHGPWTPSNVLHLCGDGTRGCHGRITDTRTEYYNDTPVLVAGGLVLLDDDGGITALLGGVA